MARLLNPPLDEKWSASWKAFSPHDAMRRAGVWIPPTCRSYPSATLFQHSNPSRGNFRGDNGDRHLVTSGGTAAAAEDLHENLPSCVMELLRTLRTQPRTAIRKKDGGESPQDRLMSGKISRKLLPSIPLVVGY